MREKATALADEMDMTVININGTTQRPCKCGGWLKHWQKFSVLPQPLHCPGLLCRERAEVAAFVQCSDVKDTNWYIVPLCKLHSRSKILEISSFTLLVLADVGETCGKD
ncbi:MAG: hypothetical protein ABSH48_04060 [Verrucomicrobiota bacterium]|jgi:hypothetical protein